MQTSLVSALTYQKNDSPLSTRIARDYFLTALGDPEMEIKVRERESPELQLLTRRPYVLKRWRRRVALEKRKQYQCPRNPQKPSKATRAVHEIA